MAAHSKDTRMLTIAVSAAGWSGRGGGQGRPRPPADTRRTWAYEQGQESGVGGVWLGEQRSLGTRLRHLDHFLLPLLPKCPWIFITLFFKSLYVPPLERLVWLLGRMGHTTVHAAEGGVHSRHSISTWFGFPDGSVGKESACNARSGRSAGKGIGYPLQYSWAYLVAQLIKNPPAMWETWFDPWVGKVPWRRETLPIPVFWPGEFHGLYSPRGHKESDTTEQLHFYFLWLGPLLSWATFGKLVPYQ